MDLFLQVLERIERRVGLVAARVNGLGALADQLSQGVDFGGIVRLNAVGEALHALRLLAGDRDGRVGCPCAQQPWIRADRDDRGDDHDEKRRHQLVARHAQRKRLEHVDALEVFDRVAHLGDR